MSWAAAKAIAEGLYRSLRATHAHAFVGMIISALSRLHKAEEGGDNPPPQKNDEN